MKEIKGNMFSPTYLKFSDAICLTTNGFVKKDGSAVMGAGNAKQARDIYKRIDYDLGQSIRDYGNNVNIIREIYHNDKIIPVMSFPVKYNWWEKGNLELLERSTLQLVDLSNSKTWKKIILPRPGCYNGKLSWLSEVKPILKKYLDERFYIIALR